MAPKALKKVEIPVVRVLVQNQIPNTFHLGGIEWEWPNPQAVISEPLHAVTQAENAHTEALAYLNLLQSDPDKAELEVYRANASLSEDGEVEEDLLLTVEDLIEDARSDVEAAHAKVVEVSEAAHLVASHNTISIEVPLPMAASRAHLDVSHTYRDVKLDPSEERSLSVKSFKLALPADGRMDEMREHNYTAKAKFLAKREDLTLYMSSMEFRDLPFMVSEDLEAAE